MRLSRVFAVAGLSLGFAVPASAAGPDLGKSGTEMPGGVYCVGLPRTDLHVTLHAVELKPAFALGSWLACKPSGDTATLIGDLVLDQHEVAQ